MAQNTPSPPSSIPSTHPANHCQAFCPSQRISCFIPRGQTLVASQPPQIGLNILHYFSYFPLCRAAMGRPRTLAILPPTGRHCVTERTWNEKHLIVWRRFSTASVGEPAELFAQNQVKTCLESRWVALSRVSFRPHPARWRRQQSHCHQQKVSIWRNGNVLSFHWIVWKT